MSELSKKLRSEAQELFCPGQSMYDLLVAAADKLEEYEQGSEKAWAEAVANSYCKFAEVPDEFKPGVKALLDKLFDPNAPVPPMTMHSMTYKPDGEST